MTAKNPHDLSNVRPTAELDRSAGHGQAGYTQSAQGQPPSRPLRRRQRRRKPAQQPRRRWSIWGKLAVGLTAVIILCAAGITALISVIAPSTLVRAELERQIKAETGRDLRISGGSSFVFYPNFAVTLGKVALSGTQPGRPILTADQINVSVALLPLLNKRVRLERIVLVRPVVDLHVDANGRPNWLFIQSASQARPVRIAQAGTGLGVWKNILPRAGSGEIAPRQVSLPAVGTALGQLELRSVTLAKARILYRDEQAGTAEQLDDLDLQISGRRIVDPMAVRGDALWRNERFSFSADITTVGELLAGKSTKVRLTLSGSSLSAGFDGSVKAKDKLATHGQSRIEGASLERAANWLGVRLPNAAPLGGFMLSGRIVGTPGSIALSGANLHLGKAKAVGALKVEFGGGRPLATGDLKVSELNVDRLMAGLAGSQGRLLPTQVPRQTQPGSGKPASIEDLIRRSRTKPEGGAGRFAPQVRGYTNRNEWSNDPIDVSQLQQFDVKARLRVDGLTAAGLVITRSTIRLALVNGVARADIEDLQLYDGKGKGVVTAQPTRNGLGFGANLNVKQVLARQLLGDAAGLDRIEGRGDLNLLVSGSGGSQRAIAESVTGSAGINLKDGAIVGWDIARILKGLEQGRLPELKAAPSQKTQFSELAASFKITEGNAVTNDLRLVSPVLQVKGQGDVRIGGRSLDLALQPKLIASWQQPSASGDPQGGLEVPIKLKGPWHDPRIVLDTAEFVKDPNKLIDQAKEFGRRFKGKNLGDIVRGVLGDDDDGKPRKAKDILKNLLGR